jgi:hypothetical protein
MNRQGTRRDTEGVDGTFWLGFDLSGIVYGVDEIPRRKLVWDGTYERMT